MRSVLSAHARVEPLQDALRFLVVDGPAGDLRPHPGREMHVDAPRVGMAPEAVQAAQPLRERPDAACLRDQ